VNNFWSNTAVWLNVISLALKFRAEVR